MSVNPWVVLMILAVIFFVTALIGAVWICMELTVDEQSERTPY